MRASVMKLRLIVTLIVMLAVAGLAIMQPPVVVAQTRAAPESPLLKLKGLVSLCEGRDPTSTAACGAYISGFVDGSHSAQRAAVANAVADQVVRGAVAPADDAIEKAATNLQEQSNRFCIRSVWSASYVQAVVVQYGHEHPDLLAQLPQLARRNKEFRGEPHRKFLKSFDLGLQTRV